MIQDDSVRYSGGSLPIIDCLFLFYFLYRSFLPPFGGLFFQFYWASIGRSFFGLSYSYAGFSSPSLDFHPFVSCVGCLEMMAVSFWSANNFMAHSVAQNAMRCVLGLCPLPDGPFFFIIGETILNFGRRKKRVL